MSNLSSNESSDTGAQGYFYTDWSAMTSQDWAGMAVTIVTFILMAIAYFYVFRPKNKDKLEAQKNMLFDDQLLDEPSFDNESTNTEKNNVGK